MHVQHHHYNEKYESKYVSWVLYRKLNANVFPVFSDLHVHQAYRNKLWFLNIEASLSFWSHEYKSF